MDILSIAAALAAFFVKGLSGFANALIFGAMMNFGADNLQITPLGTLLSTPSNLFIAWKERKKISVKTFLLLTAIMMIGAVPGTFLLKTADTGLLKKVFGILIVALAAEMLLRRPGAAKESPRWLMVVIGLLSGICCGLFGVSALLAAYCSRAFPDPGQFRGTLCAVFAADNVFRLVLYACTGVLTAEILVKAAVLLPFTAIGLGAGLLLSGRLKAETVRKIVIILLIFSGIALIFGV